MPPHVPPVARAEILTVLLEQYGLAATGLVPLTEGLDEAAWTYRVVVDAGPEHVLKLATGEPRPADYDVPRRLRDSGVDAVVAPLSTTAGRGFVELHGLTWSLYPFVDGADGWTRRMGDRDWHHLGAALRAVHDASLPDLAVRREEFDLTPYETLSTWDAAVRRAAGPSDPRRVFTAVWQTHHGTTAGLLAQMRVLAGYLRDHPRHDVLCHGDLHPGNVLIDRAGVHLIDWGDTLLAPRERDFIFVPPEGAAARPLAAAFLDGYRMSAADIDWPTLTYYRCERVLQDVIAWAESVFVDTAGVDYERAAYWLLKVFESGSEADAARDACRHLPPQLDALR